ncbi:alpha/beta hydrolase [Saccharothrix algeriensis]|uniref:Membrane protein n=1 Tax=Saccharothrix algeriensis TaxID=173560 RepID=A0ABS2S0Z0_9PSEU|nr:alpha/beta-hydrolase family protein [Saccharothrix algeriensis]MBM7809904.1 putative membrane protein [Saccharothrix algeriensis]
MAFATVFFAWSMTPSLLPRPWYLQGVAAGICSATGYLVGVGVARLTRWFGVRPRWSPETRRWGNAVFAAVAAVWVPGSLVLGARWQRQVRELVGVDPDQPFYYGLVLAVALAVAVGLREVGRLLRAASRRVARFCGRFVPVGVARFAAVVVVAVLTVTFVDGALVNGFLGVVNRIAATADRGDGPGVVRPAAAERSGSPSSRVSWESLGREGRAFVAGGPTAAELSAFTGRPAPTPIRVYGGLSSAGSLAGVAELVVAELERTGAFDRAVLAVATTTGTGWVDPATAEALEYVLGGDTAIAALQYSYLPSWAAFVADRDSPRAAGSTLFDQVHAAWERQPPDRRPRLVAFGESLGAFGGQAAFSGLQDMATRTSGALWVGTPNSTAVWEELTAARDPGTPERLPVVGDGARVRFADRPADLDLGTPWEPGRVVYLQHATDPVVWWSPRLLTGRPDWLAEPLGPDVSPQMTWLPAVTFWQLTMDMVFSTGVPPGHGHHYGPVENVEAWSRILAPPGWTAEDTARYGDLVEARAGR